MKSRNFKFGIVVAVGKSIDHNSQTSKMVAMETKNCIKINFYAGEHDEGVDSYKIDAN